MVWLPPLIRLEDFGGDWGAYESALYEAFCKDWIFGPQAVVRGKRVSIEKVPLYKGKEFAFWHLTSEGKVEDRRLPDLRRSERINWIRALLEQIDTENTIAWENRRKGKKGLVVSLPDYSYAVAIRDRTSHFVLKTAFPVTWEHTRQRHEREHTEYLARVSQLP